MMVLNKGTRRLEQHVACVVEGNTIRQPDGRQHARLRMIMVFQISPVKEHSTQLTEIIVCIYHLKRKSNQLIKNINLHTPLVTEIGLYIPKKWINELG